MILVISDDFTGAAEIAGISMEFGLDTEIQTKFDIKTSVDVVIVDTNTRSKRSRQEATNELDKLLQKVTRYEFDFLFKKVDSVLRGHVCQELSVILHYYLDQSILLIPSNPSKGRTISKGRYLIEGKLLHNTFFSADPEFPVEASDIYSLLNSEAKDKIQIIGESLPPILEKGRIFVPDANNLEQIEKWSNEITDKLLPAGAADFWREILKTKKATNKNERVSQVSFDDKNRLFVCGSSLSDPKFIKSKLISRDTKIVNVLDKQPDAGNPKNLIENIGKEVVELFDTYKNIILGTGGAKLFEINFPKLLAGISHQISSEICDVEFFIEGGTTASEIVRVISQGKLKPITQFEQGVIRMEVVGRPSLKITVKPGSYIWPKEMWDKL